MAVFSSIGGGGGITSDEVNVTASNVEVNRTYLGADTNDGVGVGTLRNATNDTNIRFNNSNSTKVISGDDSFIETNTDGIRRALVRFNQPRGVIEGNTLIGIPETTMANSGGLTASKLLKGQSAFGISGTATSDANADASKIISGYSGYVNGVKINGNLVVSSVINFNVAQYSNLTLICTWALPSNGMWSGLRIMCRQGSYPNTPSEGTLFYEGNGAYATKELAEGTWYFRAWNYITTNYGRTYGSYTDKVASNIKIQGQQVFTSSGIFTVPQNIRNIQVFCVGAGGYGGWGDYYESAAQGGAGGGGGLTITKSVSVTPGQQCSVVIGEPVALTNTSSPVRSGSTIFNSDVIALGGEGLRYWKIGGFGRGGDGGSGGGAPAESGYTYEPVNGGSDGGNGVGGIGVGGIGQGTTTRAFGESSNTLYSGGGGGGGYISPTDSSSRGGNSGYGGAGGAGDGGYGSTAGIREGKPATPNTGSGGGGGGSVRASNAGYEGGRGGSGICIIRWGY